jgi:hypothetical protein
MRVQVNSWALKLLLTGPCWFCFCFFSALRRSPPWHRNNAPAPRLGKLRAFITLHLFSPDRLLLSSHGTGSLGLSVWRFAGDARLFALRSQLRFFLYFLPRASESMLYFEYVCSAALLNYFL